MVKGYFIVFWYILNGGTKGRDGRRAGERVEEKSSRRTPRVATSGRREGLFVRPLRCARGIRSVSAEPSIPVVGIGLLSCVIAFACVWVPA